MGRPQKTQGALTALVLYGASLACLLLAADRLGIGPGEAPRLRAAMDLAAVFSGGSGSVIERAQQGGWSATLLPTMLSSLCWSLARRLGVGDALVTLRLGSVLIAAAAAPLLQALLRPSLGAGLAVLATLLALLVPRGIEQSALLGGDGVLVTFSLAALVCYLRAEGRGHKLAWAMGSGVCFGLALSVSWSALLLLPAALVHHALSRPLRSARLARRGLLSLPVSLAAWITLALPMRVLTTPLLWTHTLSRLGDLLAMAASPTIGAGTWGAEPVLPDTIPRGHSAQMLVLSLPSTTAIFALVGLFAISTGGGGWRRHPAVSLSVLVSVSVLGWPLIAPPGLLAFPGHFALVVPFAATIAAVGLVFVCRALVASRVLGGQGRWFAVALLLVSVLGPAWASLHDASTLSASFSWSMGGPWRAARGQTVPLHDGTPALALARDIDALGLDRAAVFSPSLPAERWQMLTTLGRLRTHLVTVHRPEDASLLVLMGNTTLPPGDSARLVSAIARDGQPLLTLYAR